MANIQEVVTYTVAIEPKTIDKKELAKFLGYSISSIEKKGECELPPKIKGSNHLWFFPTVVQWCIENSQPLSMTKLKKIKIR